MRIVFAIAALLSAAACGGSSPTTPDPQPPAPAPVQAPSITCPANVSVDTALPAAVVSFAAPVVTDGTQPTTTSCTVKSGDSLPVGTTTVTCTATDAINRTATCNFTATVVLRVFVKYTRFMAFGDSVTAGEVSNSSSPIFGPRLVDPINNYPKVLEGLLSARYKQQSLSVVNRGLSGETAADGADRLRQVLLSGPVPDVLLLLEGYNEMTRQDENNVDSIPVTLSVDIDEARRRGVSQVILATFTPARDLGNGRYVLPNIVRINSEIRAVAARKGVLLADLYAAMVGQANTFIGDDGLHPTVAGYAKIADTFNTVIKSAYEQANAPSARLRR